MLKDVYLAIQRLLFSGGLVGFNYPLPIVFSATASGPDLVKHYDWFNGNQRSPDGKDKSLPYDVPAALIEFLPIQFEGLTNKLLQTPLTFNIYLVQERIMDKQANNPKQELGLEHLQLIEDVIVRLTGAMANTADGEPLLSSLQLLSLTPDHFADTRHVTVLQFSGTAFETKTETQYLMKLIPDNDVTGQSC